jgi:hypothetical protein
MYAISGKKSAMTFSCCPRHRCCREMTTDGFFSSASSTRGTGPRLAVRSNRMRARVHVPCGRQREEAGIRVELGAILGVFGGPDYRVTYPNSDESAYVVRSSVPP